jgi:N6-L-threonylcarbamoyladenine synthase
MWYLVYFGGIIVFLGIDTSAYTTSIALITGEGRVYADRRILLPVPTGQQGLQQSTALFFHLRNLPGMLEEIFRTVSGKDILSVAVSTRPRPLPDSYMPVFWAGKSMASGLAAALKVPLVKTSHQEGCFCP